MPLTPQEKAELDAINGELRKRGALPKAPGLTADEQRELASINTELKRRGELKGASPLPNGIKAPPSSNPTSPKYQPPATPQPRPSFGANLKEGLMATPIPGFGVTPGQVAQGYRGYQSGKNAINAGINESVKPPSAPGQGFADIGRAMKTGFNSPTVVSAEPLHNPPNASKTRKLITKAGNFLVDAAFDPAQALAAGPAGKLADEAFVSARKMAAAQIMRIPAVQRGIAKAQRIVQPLVDSAAGQAAIRGLGWFGVGPQARMMKAVSQDYKQELNVHAQKVADTLTEINTATTNAMRDPAKRKIIHDMAATNNGRNPVPQLVIDTLRAERGPGHLSFKATQDEKTRIAQTAELLGVDPKLITQWADRTGQHMDEVNTLLLKAGGVHSPGSANLGKIAPPPAARVAKPEPTYLPPQQRHEPMVGPQPFEEMSRKMLPYGEPTGYMKSFQQPLHAPAKPLNTAELPTTTAPLIHFRASTTKAQEIPNIKPRLAYRTDAPLEQKIKVDTEQWLQQMFGEDVKQGQTVTERLLERSQKVGAAQVNLTQVRESGVRNLINDMPAKHPEWVQPITEALRPGWVALPDAGVLNSLHGYQMPKALYNLLQNELAGAALTPAHQIRSEYIIMKDIKEALAKNVFGTIKKAFIGQMQTQDANLVTNLGQQALMLRETGVRASHAERSRLMVEGFKDAIAMNKGVRSKAVQEMSQYSPSLMQTQIESAIGKPSPEFGQLPTVVGSGRASLALPTPQGLTARVFGEGKGGTAAATTFKALGVVNPVEQLANFQTLAERATKIASYRILRKKFDAKTATALVEKYHFDYTDRSHAAEMADKFGIWIFNAFPMKQFNQFVDTLVNHPSELYRYKRLRDIAVGADDPSQNKDLPEWMRNSPLTVPLDNHGQDYVNVSRFHPLGGTVDWLANLAHDGIDLQKEQSNLLDKPILSPAVWALGGHQAFTYDDRSHPALLQEGQPGNELPGLKAKELAKSYLPGMLGGRASQAYSAAQQGVGQTDTALPRTPEDVNLQYMLGLRVKEAKAPMSALVEREVAKANRMGPAGTAYAHALAKAWTEATPSDIKTAYPKLDAGRDPVGYQQQFQRLNSYISKLLGSSQVTSKSGKVVNPQRLENAARAFVWFVRSVQEGRQ